MGKVWRGLCPRFSEVFLDSHHRLSPTDDPNAAEVVKISKGRFFLVREENTRSDRECIYNGAMATIRRVPSTSHHFQLVITPVYEDRDQGIHVDEDKTDAEQSFLIGEELQFRTWEIAGKPTFIWRDLEGDVGEFFEFVATGTNAPTRAFFETCMYRAMYERKYRKGADNRSDSELAEFIWQPPKKDQGKAKKIPTAAIPIPVVEKESPVIAMPTPKKAAPEPEPVPAPALAPTPAPAQSEAVIASSMPYLVSVPAQLYLWNVEKAFYEQQAEDIEIAARIIQLDKAYNYWLAAMSSDGQFMGHHIDSGLNQRYAVKALSVTWNHVSDAGKQSSWCFRFLNGEDYNAFVAACTKALWETLNQLPYDKIKPNEEAYLMSSNTEDVEMRDAKDELANDEESEEEVDDELEPDENEVSALPPGQNEQLTVGCKGDRTFVVRGNSIGVFSHTGRDEVKYVGSIKQVAAPKGRSFKPSQVMLHEQDSRMVLMNPDAPNSLFSLDLEVGKVVEEWKVNDDILVRYIAPESKFAQTTHEQTLVGVSGNALFRIDPRISGTKLVDSQYKQYASKNKFSGVTTTAAGKLVVVSEKGDIRLFDSIGKNAKTALPPLGDPIIGIDVTSDGRWIVATTKTYLLLINTVIGEGQYAGQLGFDRSFSANAKPITRRLQLRAEHVVYMGHAVSFSPARFNTGEGKEEVAIVTSTGEFVIAWDFANVKDGYLDKYEMKKYKDNVVQDNFKFGDDKQIVSHMMIYLVYEVLCLSILLLDRRIAQ
ncbi:hypothetical protein EIP86_009980 [Pleurotus ostreatoroseus]|nr:hypothetical protein EIP86_009980 [Pleurotus ostreatoroseus]